MVARFRKQLTELPLRSYTLGQDDPNNITTSVIDCTLVCKTDLPGSVSPLCIMALTATANLSVYGTPPDGVFPHIPAPPVAQLQHSKITCTMFCSVSRHFLSDLNQAGDIRWQARHWPVMGGSSAIQPQMSTDILVTGHADGTVFFWDISSVQLVLIYALDVLASSSPPPAVAAIQTIDLCPASRILACSCKKGETFIFQFNDAPVTHTEMVTVIKKKKVPAPSAPPPINRGSKPPVESLDLVDTPSGSGGGRMSSSRKRGKGSREPSGGEPTFSWKSFFLNAGIAKETAAEYAKSFSSQKITEDLIQELDKELLEMSGVTAVGDKMRIWKYIKNSYCREDCLRAPRSSKSKSSKSSSKSKSSRRKKEASSSSAAMQEMARTPAASPQASPVPAMIEVEEEVTKEVTRTVPGGYQVKIQCSFKNPITQMKVASSLSKYVPVHTCHPRWLPLTHGQACGWRQKGQRRSGRHRLRESAAAQVPGQQRRLACRLALL